MTYAIAQKELVVPDVERLARAFAVVPDLTAIDAQNAANDAYGILWRGLDAEHAGALQAALIHEGVETEVVPEAEFPALATAAKVIRQVEFRPEHLLVTDPMQRVTELPWSEILLVGGGRVLDGDRSRSHATDAEGGEHKDTSRLVLDLFLIDRSTRLEATAEDFNFGHLGQRLSDDAATNYLFLLQELEEHVPQASLNQGAYLACQKPPQLFSYPSKHAYQEELVWILWRIGQLVAATERGGVRRPTSR